MTAVLLLVAFVVGAVVANLLFWQYAFRSPWRSTLTGWVLISLFAVTALSYNLAVAVLVWPEVFRESAGGLWSRIVLRFLIDGALIGMYLLLRRAQRRDRNAPTVDPVSAPDPFRRP